MPAVIVSEKFQEDLQEEEGQLEYMYEVQCQEGGQQGGTGSDFSFVNPSFMWAAPPDSSTSVGGGLVRVKADRDHGPSSSYVLGGSDDTY